MTNFQDTLDELFSDKLNFQYNGQPLPTPEIDGNENIINYTKEYEGLGTDIILVECNDRIIEFQKKLIKNQKSYFPNAHFLFVSNGGKVFDIYNNSTSKKLKKITYDVIGRNTRLFKEKLQLFDVTNASDGTELQINVEKAFDTSDKVTKKFFDKFKKIHDKLQKAITGIDDVKDKSWYASVMMNRIMFIYFLQKHYVIQNNTDFLLQKFDEVTANGKDYYKDFLLPLFFYGFARRDNHPEKLKFVKEYGAIRYLNGGLFYPHYLEKKYTNENASSSIYEEKALQTNIGIDANLLKEILTFLNGYTWYLDNRPMKEDTDINPDVLGYIFEKYINQKELGAYYTKEDITEYISKNTIIPFILDKMKVNGFDAPDPNPMITNNEDIIGNIGNYIDTITDYKEVKYLYKDVLLELSVLDPAVGSGAFLFSALNILLPIYQKAVFRLKEFNKTVKDDWLKETIDTINKHAEEYFLTKQIILNNLYGVDIVEEATEICKLRLFLQLASHLPDIKSIEPLPDIDFNIYAGNSLVGGLSWEDLEANYTMDLFTSANRDNIKADITTLSNLKTQYRTIQQNDDNEDELTLLKDNITTLEHRVNNDINIGIDNPFHWFIDFNKILEKGGFDVIIGNPPYVEYNQVKKSYQIVGYSTVKCGNIYSNFIERSFKLINNKSRFGMIVPISIACSKRMEKCQELLFNKGFFVSNYGWRPAKLFEGSKSANLSLSIVITNNEKKCYSTTYNRWYSDERIEVFKNLSYTEILSKKTKYVIPKISEQIENDIYQKIYKLNDIEKVVSKNQTPYVLYYRRTGGLYWKIFTDFQPIVFLDGVKTTSSKEATLNFKTEEDLMVTLALLWSDLYWWWYIINSDERNNNPSDLKTFPIVNDIYSNSEIIPLAKKLIKDLKNKSVWDERNYRGTVSKFQKFFPKYSKEIIEKIDDIVFKYYDFNVNEIDYLKKFDSRFRMGNKNSNIVE